MSWCTSRRSAEICLSAHFESRHSFALRSCRFEDGSCRFRRRKTAPASVQNHIDRIARAGLPAGAALKKVRKSVGRQIGRYQQTLNGSFSAVSKPIFGCRYLSFRIFRVLHTSASFQIKKYSNLCQTFRRFILLPSSRKMSSFEHLIAIF